MTLGGPFTFPAFIAGQKEPMLYMDQSIFDFLQAEVDRANEQYIRAKERFYKIAAATPKGLPPEDATQWVANAARDQIVAMANYAKAIRQLNAFLLDGTVPEELSKAVNKKTLSAGA